MSEPVLPSSFDNDVSSNVRVYRCFQCNDEVFTVPAGATPNREVMAEVANEHISSKHSD